VLLHGKCPAAGFDIGDVGRARLGPMPGNAPEKGRVLIEGLFLLLAGPIPEVPKGTLRILGRHQIGKPGDLIDRTSSMEAVDAAVFERFRAALTAAEAICRICLRRLATVAGRNGDR